MNKWIRLLTSAKELADLAEQNLKEIGGCDHSVGICCCGDIRKLETARAVIAECEKRSAIDKAESGTETHFRPISAPYPTGMKDWMRHT